MRIRTILVAVSLVGLSSIVVAGEADDLQRMIDTAKQNAKDLEGLDEQKSVREELTMLRVWLDAAWRLRSDAKFDEVRVVLDRCQAQGDMIRQKIAAAKLSAEAARKEDELKRMRAQVAKTKEAIQAAMLQKAALEGRSK